METGIGVLGSALGFESTSEVKSFLKFLNNQNSHESQPFANARDTPFRIYEHLQNKAKQKYTLHSELDIQLGIQAGILQQNSAEYLSLNNNVRIDANDSNQYNLAISARISEREAVALVNYALLQAGRRVEIWQRVSSNSVNYTKKLSGSPGNHSALETFLEPETESQSKSSLEFPVSSTNVGDGVLAVRFMTDSHGILLMGTASVDSSVREIRLREVKLVLDERIDALETALVSTQAREILLCHGDLSDFELRTLNEILADLGTAKSILPKSNFTSVGVPNVLADLAVLDNVNQLDCLSLDAALGASGALIDFLGLRSLGISERSRFKIKVMDSMCNDFVLLDAAAVRALNVLPTGKHDCGRSGSLYGLLNRCSTPIGSRLLKRTLAQPPRNLKMINTRLKRVGCVLEEHEIRAALTGQHLKRIPDLSALCKKFSKSPPKASLQDVVRLYQFSIRLPLLIDQLRGLHRSLSTNAFEEMIADLDKLAKELETFETLVETTVDLDRTDNHEYVIVSDMDSSLLSLQNSKDSVLTEISDIFEKAESDLGTKSDQLKLERKPNLGYILRLTRKDEKLIRGRTSQYHVLETRKDGVRFTTKALRRASSRFDELSAEYDEKQSALKRKTLEVVATYVPVFEDAASLLAELDMICAFASTAADASVPYSKPEIMASGACLMTGARHPMVEEALNGSPFIANDVDLTRSSEEHDQGALVILTGPNGNGKSTYTRMVGVITLMALCGSFVPAVSARISMVDRILARVGAGDNQLRGVSTFMAEMLETASILRSATNKSLVIVDELGRGTSTYDGFGLAMSIAKHISTHIKAQCLFATHFHELTALEHSVEPGSVRNLHVSATTKSDGTSLVFLYKVLPGPCSQSFGINVAEMAGFPRGVLESAKRKANELEDFKNGPAKPEKVAKLEDSIASSFGTGERAVSDFMSEFRDVELSFMASREAVNTVRLLVQRTTAISPEFAEIFQS